MASPANATTAGSIEIGGDLVVRRLGFGAMRITGPGIWGEPPDEGQAKATLRRVVDLGVNFIDTADSYGPFPVHSPIIAKIEVVTRGDVRRAKLYYLRDRIGKAAKRSKRSGSASTPLV